LGKQEIAMTKTIKSLLLLGAMASISAMPASARKPAPAKTEYRWERMSIVQVLPSQVFARLGLTHSTRYGFTRDGHTKKTPDPTFPPGLTDVVPYDATHLLLMRGTTQGLAQFRTRVLAAVTEITSGAHWHVSAQLLPGLGGDALGPVVMQDVATDQPFTVTIGAPPDLHVYRLRLHLNADATQTMTYQVSLSPLPTGGAQEVLTPGQIWSPSTTRPLLPGGTVVLDDLAADRQSARKRLSMPDDMDTLDYQVRLSVVAPIPPTVVSPSATDTPPPADPDSETPTPPTTREEPNAPQR
jgi:hypothetical protein